MTFLILGVALWAAAHLFKRVAPTARVAIGRAGPAVVSLLILVSLIMMVVGYRQAPTQFFWGRTTALVGVNNLLMLLAVYLMAASVGKTWITGKIRHPQLTAVKSWAVAHLLVNGDTASFILFGGLLAWAVASVIIISKQDGKPQLQVASSPIREFVTATASILAFAAIAFAHIHIGYPVFG